MENKTVNFAISPPYNLYEKMIKKAKDLGISVSAFIRKVIEDELIDIGMWPPNSGEDASLE